MPARGDVPPPIVHGDARHSDSTISTSAGWAGGGAAAREKGTAFRLAALQCPGLPDRRPGSLARDDRGREGVEPVEHGQAAETGDTAAGIGESLRPFIGSRSIGLHATELISSGQSVASGHEVATPGLASWVASIQASMVGALVFGSAAPERASAVWLRVDRSDHMLVLSITGATGLVVAVVMAVFGLPPVDLHSPFHYAGIMDPLCGGTRAARLTAQGNLQAAWRYNPLGILATVAAASALVRLLVGLATQRWISVRFAWSPRRRRVAYAIVIAAMVALEFRQQGRADLLMQRH